MIAAFREVNGERVGFLLPDVPDDAPEQVQEGLVRRRLTALDGQCPCGARMVLPPRAERRRAARTGQVVHVEIVHEQDCEAVDSNLTAALRRWSR